VAPTEDAPKPKEADPQTPPPQALPISHATPTRIDVPDAPAPAPSPDAAKLVKDIADQIGLLAGQGKSDFHLQLRPEALGRLSVHLSMDDGGVTVRMHADSAQAKAMIDSNLSQLKQSFQDQGIRVDRFVVNVSQGQFSQDGQHPRRSRGWVDDVRANRGQADDGDFAEALAAAGSSRPVDYRA
jgi:flagellar hook-length control protein FliK